MCDVDQRTAQIRMRLLTLIFKRLELKDLRVRIEAK